MSTMLKYCSQSFAVGMVIISFLFSSSVWILRNTSVEQTSSIAWLVWTYKATIIFSYISEGTVWKMHRKYEILSKYERTF